MRRLIASLAALALFAAAPAFADADATAEPRLRAAPMASGPAITLGDLFENAGAAAGRAVAPSPAPGRSTQLNIATIAAAAAAGGLAWTPPAGVARVSVSRGALADGARSASGEAAIRQGDTVVLTYQTASLRVSTRVRALSDAAIGERVSLINPQSERRIEGVATGPGAASASPP